MLALESRRKRSVMQGKAGSDVLCQFQSTDVMVNWIHMPLPTRNEVARRWHSIVIGENEYWLILFQVLLQPEAVARGAGDTTGYVAVGPVFLLYWPRIASDLWCCSAPGLRPEKQGLVPIMGLLSPGAPPCFRQGCLGARAAKWACWDHLCDWGGGLVLKAGFCSGW